MEITISFLVMKKKKHQLSLSLLQIEEVKRFHSLKKLGWGAHCYISFLLPFYNRKTNKDD